MHKKAKLEIERWLHDMKVTVNETILNGEQTSLHENFFDDVLAISNIKSAAGSA